MVLGLGDVVNALENIAHDIASIPSKIAEIPSAIKNGITNLVTGIINVLKSIWEALSSVLKAIMNGFVALGGYLIKAFEKVGSAIKDFFSWLWDKITNIFDDLVGMLERVLNWLWTHITNVVDWVRKSIGDVAGSVSLGLTNAFTGVVNNSLFAIPDIVRYDSAIYGVWKGLEEIINAKSSKDVEWGLFKLIGVPLFGAIAGDLIEALSRGALYYEPVPPESVMNAFLPMTMTSQPINPPNYQPAEPVINVRATASPVYAQAYGLVRLESIETTVQEVAYPRVEVGVTAEVVTEKSEVVGVNTSSTVSVGAKANVTFITGVEVKASSTVDVTSKATVNLLSAGTKEVNASATVSANSTVGINFINVTPSPTTENITVGSVVNATSTAGVNFINVTPPTTTKNVSVNSSVNVGSSVSVSLQNVPVPTPVTPKPTTTNTNSTTEGSSSSSGTTTSSTTPTTTTSTKEGNVSVQPTPSGENVSTE